MFACGPDSLIQIIAVISNICVTLEESLSQAGMLEFPHLCSVGGERLLTALSARMKIFLHMTSQLNHLGTSQNPPSPEIVISEVTSVLSIRNGLNCSEKSNDAVRFANHLVTRRLLRASSIWHMVTIM